MGRITSFIKTQFRYMFTGLISWLPIGVVLIGGVYLFGNLENFGHNFLNLFLSEDWLPAGLGIALWVLVFYITGFLLKRITAPAFISRVPLLGMFVGGGQEAMTLDKLANLEPCLFLYSPTCPSYGWILWEQKVMVAEGGAGFCLATVYYPNVPTLVTGQILSVRQETVMKLANSSSEMINVLLYGLRRPANLKFIPWPGETEQDFAKRASGFGLA